MRSGWETVSQDWQESSIQGDCTRKSSHVPGQSKLAKIAEVSTNVAHPPLNDVFKTVIASLLLVLGTGTINAAEFPYRSEAFTRFVQDSYDAEGEKEPTDFYRWMEAASVGAGWKDGISLQALRERRRQAKLSSGVADHEIAFAKEVHRMVKKAIPKFSLDRGFEFVNTVKRGERQCYLQSILVSGIFQSAGMDSGVAMVWSNEKGQTSNNGHAVCLLRLSNGKDLVVDCSEPYPFATHQGLFTSSGSGYRFVRPTYDPVSKQILGYRSADGGKTSAIRGLDMDFLNSQFDYYRGERAPGGFMVGRKTPEGLAQSEKYLRRAVAKCPKNPLAQYVLGHVLLRQGKLGEAKKRYRTALNWYQTFGYVPTGVAEAAK
jgi:hypothetical protein